LIKILAGVYHPDEGGQIRLGWTGETITDPYSAIRHGISIIYQDISLYPNLSIAENICMGKDDKRFISHRRQEKVAVEDMKLLDIEIDTRKRLEDVSIGVQQMVAIARAVYFESRVIVMDEPTASLSSGEVDKLYHIIEMLRKRIFPSCIAATNLKRYSVYPTGSAFCGTEIISGPSVQKRCPRISWSSIW
jgi:ABC-type sugar transport system ATPase subunit